MVQVLAQALQHAVVVPDRWGLVLTSRKVALQLDTDHKGTLSRQPRTSWLPVSENLPQKRSNF